MFERLRTVSMILLLMGAASGVAFATSTPPAVAAVAPQGACKGVVVDEDGEPLIGATVMVKGTQNGASTDIDGNFSLANVKNGAVLTVSYVGCVTQEVKWNGQDLKVVLKSDSKVLTEVTVTAFGIAKQDRSVGYATSKVSTNDVMRANQINPVNALQGKVAGVQIDLGGASGVTSSSAITIRGAKSVDKNNSPIWVIDGMVIQEPVTGNLSGTDWGSQLKNLNPADYESITVLKGAAATALYGSRGANGAIVIVSKGGKYGKQGLGVEINQTLEWTSIYKSYVDMQNIYGAGTTYNGTQGGFLADGTLQNTANSFGPKMDGSLRNQREASGVETPFVPHPNNWRALFNTGMNSTTNVAISGGNETANFRVSYGYTDQKGVFKGNDFNRHNIAFKGNAELNKVFSVEMGIKYAFSTANNGASQGGWDWGNNAGMLATYYMPRNWDLQKYVTEFIDENGNLETKSRQAGNIGSYLWGRTKNTKERKEQSILADLTLRAKIAPWLTASIKANYNRYSYDYLEKSYASKLDNPSGYYYGRSGNTEGSYNFLGMLQSNGNKIKIGEEVINLDAIVAAELYGNTAKNSWSKGTTGGFVVPGIFAYSNSKNVITPSYSYTPANQQTFGLSAILNLSWRDQVFLEVTARNDWMSTLAYPKYVVGAKNNYTVFYPSVNASWVFTDTFKDGMPEWFSFGKLRASWARVGMGTSAYATTAGYGVFSQSTIYTPDRGGNVVSATANLGTAFNPDLKPEIQQSIEIGTDLRFFNERLTLDLAYYKTNTFNQILSVGGVSESGASSQKINAGNIQNQGVEIQLEGTPIRTKDWRWTIGANLAVNRGKVVKLNEYVKEWCLMGGYDAAPEIWAYEGGGFGVMTSNLNSSYSTPIAKDEKTGKMLIRFAQMYGNQNPVAMYEPVTYYDQGKRERHILGKVEPDFTIALNTSVSYKDFDLFVQVDGRVGGNFYSNMWKYGSSGGTFKSTLRGRDKEHGGIARINYKGEVVYDGLMLDAVFEEGAKAPLMNTDGTAGDLIEVGGKTYAEAMEMGVIPVMTGSWYVWNYGWGMPAHDEAIQKNTWLNLREITLGYRLPEKICKKFGANYLRLGFTARNICYLVNKLTDGLNPASISSNNPLQPMDIGAVPFSRSYAVNLTVRF